MAFDIVYVIKAVDQFTAVSKRVEKSLESLQRAQGHVNKSMTEALILHKRLRSITSNLGRTQKIIKSPHSFKATSDAVKVATGQAKQHTAQIKRMRKAYNRLWLQQKKVNKGLQRGSTVGKGFSTVLTSIRFRVASLITTMAWQALTMRRVIDHAKEYEEEFFEVQALTGFTDKKMRKLANTANDLGIIFGQTTAKMLLGTRKIAAKKFELITKEDLQGIKEMSMWAAILTTKELSMERASTALAGSLNVMGEGIDQAARFSNVLAAASRFTASEIHQTAAAVVKSGAAAKAVGLDFEQLVTLLGVLARAELSAQTGGVALNTVLIRMAKEGIQFGKDMNLADIFGEVEKTVMRIGTQQEKILFQAKLYGLRQFRAGDALQKNADLLRETKKLITGTNVAIEQAVIRLNKYERIVTAIQSTLDKPKMEFFASIKEGLIHINKSWAFLQLQFLRSKGLRSFINLVMKGASWVVRLFGYFIHLLDLIGRLSLPSFMLGPTGAIDALKDWEASRREGERLLSIKALTLEEFKAKLKDITEAGRVAESKPGGAAPGTQGKVQVDINIKDPGKNVGSARLVPGDVRSSPLITGLNLGF